MEFKKHIDTITIISTILSVSYFSQNSLQTRLDSIDHRLTAVESELHTLQTETAVIKTVLIMKQILPEHLVADRKHDE